MKIAVGMSGGVDSSVAAALLKEDGHEVIGICMKLWNKDCVPLTATTNHACYGPDEAVDIEDAQRVADLLGIPFHVIDLAREYNSTILDYFRKEYLSGKTPNPCVRCNQHIKFKALIEKANRAGIKFDCFATGHYARVEYSREKKRYLLKKARDSKKDQSYWLAFLSQDQLGMAVFPLGNMTKKEVRSKALTLDMEIRDKPDSQDFFSGDYKDLLGVPPKPGPIKDRHGAVLGKHEGIWSYTIGQRRGIGIAAKRPLYVVDLDEKENTVVVGFKEELACVSLVAREVNLIALESITSPLEVSIKVRYAQRPFRGVLYPPEKGIMYVRFNDPQLAITPGQAVVFYDGDIVVGGGIIEKGEN